jgi:hypothetical protein
MDLFLAGIKTKNRVACSKQQQHKQHRQYRTVAALAPLVDCCLCCLQGSSQGIGDHLDITLALVHRRDHAAGLPLWCQKRRIVRTTCSKGLVLLACGVGGTGIAQRISGSQVTLGSRFDTTKVEAVGRPHGRAVSGGNVGKYNAFLFWKSCTSVMLSMALSHQKGHTPSCCQRMASAVYVKAFAPIFCQHAHILSRSTSSARHLQHWCWAHHRQNQRSLSCRGTSWPC